MKMCKIRGQISLELIMLILVALLGAVVVGVTIPNNLVNITSVEDTKEVVFEGFVKGGGTPVYVGGGGGSSNEGGVNGDGTSNSTENSTYTGDNSNTDSNNTTNDSDNNESNDDSNTITNGGGRIGSLTIILINGDNKATIISEAVPDGNPLPEDETIAIYYDVRKYNVEGNITSKRIEVWNTATLYLGNLSEVGTLTAELYNKANLNLNVQKIDTMELEGWWGEFDINLNAQQIDTMKLKGSGSFDMNSNVQKINTLELEGSGDVSINLNAQQIGYIGADEIKNSVDLRMAHPNINTVEIGHISGGGKLTLDSAYVDTSNIDEICGGGNLIISDSTIDTLNIGEVYGGPKLIIKDSTIGTLNIGRIYWGPQITIENAVIDILNINEIDWNPTLIIKNSIINNVVGVDITNCNRVQLTIENSTIEGVEYD